MTYESTALRAMADQVIGHYEKPQSIRSSDNLRRAAVKPCLHLQKSHICPQKELRWYHTPSELLLSKK